MVKKFFSVFLAHNVNLKRKVRDTDVNMSYNIFREFDQLRQKIRETTSAKYRANQKSPKYTDFMSSVRIIFHLFVY